MQRLHTRRRYLGISRDEAPQMSLDILGFKVACTTSWGVSAASHISGNMERTCLLFEDRVIATRIVVAINVFASAINFCSTIVLQ